MRIEIEIPKEFEKDYESDKFDEFFGRVLCDIADGTMCGRYEKETAQMLLNAFAESKPAFDVEAVVAELENLKEHGLKCEDCSFHDEADCYGLCSKGKIVRAISIVRGKE